MSSSGIDNFAATDVSSVIIPGWGHLIAEAAPSKTIAALQEFLKPHRQNQKLTASGNFVLGESSR